jgi:glutathionylspermidine synthase
MEVSPGVGAELLPRTVPCDPAGWACPGPLPAADFARVRRRLVLNHFKWDPQVGDVGTLARFPLVLPAGVVRGLFELAEALAAETAAAEAELLGRPDLTRRLGLPRAVWRAIHGPGELTPTAARVIRFDFHPTAEGWRISEANSDVPGGYAESSHFPRLMAEYLPGCRPTGDPVAAVADAIHPRLGGRARIGLLAAPGYLEDQQVVACLADAMRRRGWATQLGHPGQVTWAGGRARLGGVALDAVIRFFQGEWLGRLPAATGWRHFLRGGRTPVCNPGSAIITESKRFPVVWGELTTPLPTWRALLPETGDPRAVPWRREPGWLLKAAFANNGDEVHDRARGRPGAWRRAAWAARVSPGGWAAQRHFDPLPVATPDGMMYPCLGVYTIDGRAAGIYGRLSPRPLIDYAAMDVAVLTGMGVE